MTDKFKLLADKLNLMNDLQKEVNILREEVLDQVQMEGGQVENEYGLFVEVINKSWSYPETTKIKLNRLAEKMSQLKEASQKRGQATYEEKPSLRFMARKK